MPPRTAGLVIPPGLRRALQFGLRAAHGTLAVALARAAGLLILGGIRAIDRLEPAAGAHNQFADSAGLVAPPPLVTGLPRNAECATDHGKRSLSLRKLPTELFLLSRRKMIARGHTLRSMCQRSSESKVSAMSWVHASLSPGLRAAIYPGKTAWRGPQPQGGCAVVLGRPAASEALLKPAASFRLKFGHNHSWCGRQGRRRCPTAARMMRIIRHPHPPWCRQETGRGRMRLWPTERSSLFPIGFHLVRTSWES